MKQENTGQNSRFEQESEYVIPGFQPRKTTAGAGT